MKKMFIMLTLAVSPAMAQPIVPFPMPTPPVIAAQPYYPPVEVYVPPPVYTPPVVPMPQYIYGVTPGTTMPQPTPDYVIRPSYNGSTVYRTIPGSSMPDITQPMYIIK